MKAQCSRKNCTSGKPGMWEPIVLVWPIVADNIANQPASINVIGHAFCDACCHLVTVRELIPTKEAWEDICKVFDESKKRRPLLSTAKLTFVVPETRPLLTDVVIT